MDTVGGINSRLGFSGLASGIDTSSIIDGLTAINQRRVATLQIQRGEVSFRQATFADLRGKLLDLQGALASLSRSVAGAFDGREVTSGDPNVLTATAGTTAVEGSYTLLVQALATAHQTASQGFADPGTNIKTGTMELRLGNGESFTVTIDGSNNTLQGLAEAVNASGAPVQASIVNDGGAEPYRLLLVANRTGAANTIQITNNLDQGDGADIDPTANLVQAAGDASVKIGTGPGAITVTSASNRVDGVIAGVTLDLRQADPDRPVTLTVAPNVQSASDAVKKFVDAYNAAVEFIDARDKFDPATGESGVLFGQRDVIDLKNDLARLITSVVPGTNPKANRLSSVGIQLGQDGKLSFDVAQFERTLRGEVPGVAAADVRRLFAVTGTSDRPGVDFLLVGSRTKPTAGNPYQIDVTQSAKRASVVGSAVLIGPVMIDSSNNTFRVRLNNLASSLVRIDPGTYTPAALAAAVRHAVAAAVEFSGNQVSVDLDAGRLRITTAAYGSAARITLEGGDAMSALGFVGNESAVGQDVAGSFLVNGVAEQAVGIGQILSGNSGNANTDGLQVRVTLPDSELSAGPEANLTVSGGIAGRLGQILDRYIDPVDGRFQALKNRFDSQIEDIDSTIGRQNQILETKRQSLLNQFAAMEAAVNRLNVLSLQIAARFSPPGGQPN